MSELKHSEQIGELAKALATARKKFKAVKKEQTNPFFKSKYADLSAVIDATDDALAENGLSIVQSPLTGEGSAGVTTMLIHESGQWMRADLLLPVTKADAQGAGSAITYSRRYSYQGFVNVAAETDDDGNRASGKKGVADDAAYEKEFDKRTEGQRVVSGYQVRAWDSGTAQGVRSQTQIAAYFKNLGIKSVAEMQKADFNDAIKWLLNPKAKDLTEELTASVEHAKATKPTYTHNYPKLFAKAKEKNVPESDVKTFAKETYKAESLKDLTPFQFDDLTGWLDSL